LWVIPRRYQRSVLLSLLQNNVVLAQGQSAKGEMRSEVHAGMRAKYMEGTIDKNGTGK
jgi:hypothetical protein